MKKSAENHPRINSIANGFACFNIRTACLVALFDEIMAADSDNETWVIEAGDSIIQKEARSGLDSLTPWERLVYCLWVADYGMRNAGDLDTAHDLYADFQSEARRLAEGLSLRLTGETFSLAQQDLQRQYFERFDRICSEIRNAEPGIRAT